MDNTKILERSYQENHQDRTIYSSLALLPVLCIGIGYFGSRDVILTFLLSIPYIIQLIIWFKGFKEIYEKQKGFLMHIFCFLVCFSVLPYSIAWIIYNSYQNELSQSIFSELLAYLCLTCILGTVSLLIYLTFSLIHPEKSRLNKYISDLKQLHFLALMHFFAIFLSIAFLGGFALAFHDQATKNKALFMEKMDFNEAKNQEEEPKDYSNCTCLYFNEHTPTSDGASLEFRDIKVPAVIAGTDQNIIETRKALNAANIDKIAEYINKNNGDASKIPQILIIGKADPKPIGKGSLYSSNRELSKARIENAQYELTERLSEKHYPFLLDIIWLDKPVSFNNNITIFNKNDEPRDMNCEPIGPKEKDPYSNQRVVEIKVEFRSDLALKGKSDSKPDPLKTLDYMYFSLYTITTTGYGDIKPVTPLAKFICSLENIIEVFFLVIFVNVLISFKDSRIKPIVEEELKSIKEKMKIPSSNENEKSISEPEDALN